eukprot:TRINITY_DN8530_c0_g1_i1.p1 TRINITY_DN8530_c0_g1~~TRINITY_DN8530_c0_g1_i1.p1  ORF type:complete len:292 (-),score=36.13 TRINITY_DN8530_c0_g1_i1:908-1741(-)
MRIQLVQLVMAVCLFTTFVLYLHAPTPRHAARRTRPEIDEAEKEAVGPFASQNYPRPYAVKGVDRRPVPLVAAAGRLLAALRPLGVLRFVITGGFALRYHGWPRNTGDIDILVDQKEYTQARRDNRIEGALASAGCSLDPEYGYPDRYQCEVSSSAISHVFVELWAVDWRTVEGHVLSRSTAEFPYLDLGEILRAKLAPIAEGGGRAKDCTDAHQFVLTRPSLLALLQAQLPRLNLTRMLPRLAEEDLETLIGCACQSFIPQSERDERCSRSAAGMH